jgi:single-strand DNA-binding protein
VSINVVTLSGRIGKKPEQRLTTGGTEVTEFSIAVDKRKKEDPPMWFRITAFGKQAELMTPHAKQRLTLLQYGWDDYTNWKRGGGAEPENPYEMMNFARRAWQEGFEMAKKGKGRPEALAEVVRQ